MQVPSRDDDSWVDTDDDNEHPVDVDAADWHDQHDAQGHDDDELYRRHRRGCRTSVDRRRLACRRDLSLRGLQVLLGTSGPTSLDRPR